MAQNQQTPPTGNDVAGSALFKKFLSTAEGYIRQPTRMKKLLTDAYKKASEKNEVGTLAHEAWETLQTMFRLIKASLSGEYTGVPGTTIAAAVAVLVYFLSPIDLIPDFIPVLGLLDDVALVAWFSTTLKGEMDKFQEWELTRPTEVNTGAEEVKSAAPAASHTPAQPAPESAKNAGTGTEVDTVAHQPTTEDAAQPASESAKHAGTATHHAEDNAGSTSSAANAWEGSRNSSDASAVDTGGNVR